MDQRVGVARAGDCEGRNGDVVRGARARGAKARHSGGREARTPTQERHRGSHGRERWRGGRTRSDAGGQRRNSAQGALAATVCGAPPAASGGVGPAKRPADQRDT